MTPSNPRYDLVVADFPWKYGSQQNGGADAKYATLSVLALKELMLLHRDRTFAKDAVLALWVTVPFKWAAADLMAAGGFDYRTTLFWHKPGRIGTGYWFRNQVEELWVGVRGDVRPFRLATRNLHEEAAGPHSAKPEWFQDQLEAGGDKVGLTRRLELFARRARPGWRCEGLELTGHDHRCAFL